MSDDPLTKVVELTRQAIENLEAKLQQSEDQRKLWYAMVDAFIEETDDPDLVRRALEAVQKESA